MEVAIHLSRTHTQHPGQYGLRPAEWKLRMLPLMILLRVQLVLKVGGGDDAREGRGTGDGERLSAVT